MKKYKIDFVYFDKKSKRITMTGLWKLKPMTEKRMMILVKKELKKYPDSCYKISTHNYNFK